MAKKCEDCGERDATKVVSIRLKYQTVYTDYFFCDECNDADIEKYPHRSRIETPLEAATEQDERE